ncbi:hypothetical protein D3C84_172680 [compost metagenome]
MNPQAHLLHLMRTARLLARQLTALQLLCHSTTYAQRLPELVALHLLPLSRQLDALAVSSAGTPLNTLIQRANHHLAALLEQLASTPHITAAELAPMISPAIRLLTEAEHQAMGVKA